jgi:hypothetical protein
MAFLQDLVIKYAPTFRFHPSERYFPCGIEYLATNGTLNQHTFQPARQIPGQSTSTPALAFYNGQLVMTYTGAHDSQIWTTTSSDGWDWTPAQQIPGQHTSIPALAAFSGLLYMVYSDAHSSQLWYTWSSDGLQWSPAQQIPGQGTSVPAIVAFESCLFMVYTDSNSSQLWQSQAIQNSDGSLNWTNTKQIEGQHTSIPAITVFNSKVLMVYTDANSSQLWTSQYDGTTWAQTSQIAGQHTSVPALTAVGGWAVMIYSDSHSSQFWATRSSDGVNWQDTIQIAGQHGSIPAVATLDDVLWITYSDANSSQLWVTCTVNGDIVPHAPIANVTQVDLKATAPDPGWWIQINDSQRGGQALGQNPPLYYAVQQNSDEAKITYVLLYAYQGGQTLRAIRSGQPWFDCIIYDTGSHYGDLERVSVYLIKTDDGSWSFDGMEFEAHGDTYPSDGRYTRSQLLFDPEDTASPPTHAVVLAGLDGHGCWNPMNPNMNTKDWLIVMYNSPFVQIGDFLGNLSSTADPNWWRPWSSSAGTQNFKLLGLDSNNQPLGDQQWAAFVGRLGQSKDTNMNGAVELDGTTGLPWDQWVQVQFIWGIAKTFGLISSELQHGDGPIGPGTRPWIHQSL